MFSGSNMNMMRKKKDKSACIKNITQSVQYLRIKLFFLFLMFCKLRNPVYTHTHLMPTTGTFIVLKDTPTVLSIWISLFLEFFILLFFKRYNIFARVTAAKNTRNVGLEKTQFCKELKGLPQVVIMVKGTLNELSQLKESDFSQPQPRHGLNLLYWFACEYIDFINGQTVSIYRPQDGDFGFHKYHNRIEDDDDQLLPNQNLSYYEVGNLNDRGADKLPDYVRANYSQKNPNSNKDRIIVSQDFSRVYVTEHSDPKHFDSSRTYRVSQGLLQIIKNIRSREQYLRLTCNSLKRNYSFKEQSHKVTVPEENSWWCTIL